MEALGESGLEEIRKSVTRRQNTVAQYIATQPILDLCEMSNWRPGARVSRRWWEQDRIYLEGAKKRAVETTTRSDPDLEEVFGRGIKRGLGWRGVISGSERVEWSVVERGT